MEMVMNWAKYLCGVIVKDNVFDEEKPPQIDGIFGLISRLPPKLRIDNEKQETIDKETKLDRQQFGKLYREHSLQVREERMNLMISKEVFLK